MELICVWFPCIWLNINLSFTVCAEYWLFLVSPGGRVSSQVKQQLASRMPGAADACLWLNLRLNSLLSGMISAQASAETASQDPQLPVSDGLGPAAVSGSHSRAASLPTWWVRATRCFTSGVFTPQWTGMCGIYAEMRRFILTFCWVCVLEPEGICLWADDNVTDWADYTVAMIPDDVTARIHAGKKKHLLGSNSWLKSCDFE